MIADTSAVLIEGEEVLENSDTDINTMPPLETDKERLRIVNQWTMIAISSSMILYVTASLLTSAVNLDFNDNCRSDSIGWTCQLANVLGWLSGSVWYSVVLAQIIKDWMVTNVSKQLL